MGADVSEDSQQLGMLSVYKPDTMAPIGRVRKTKRKTQKYGKAVFLLHCSYVQQGTIGIITPFIFNASSMSINS